MGQSGSGKRVGGSLLAFLGLLLLLGGLAGLAISFNATALVVVLLGGGSLVAGVRLVRGGERVFRQAGASPIQAATFSTQAETSTTRAAIFSMQGVQDLLEVFEDTVTITPKGILAFMNKGLKGTKTIPFASISATQFKEAGAVFSGYIQFSIPGGNESRGGAFSATTDENTFMFAGQNNNELATRIKDHIESRLRELRTKQTPQPPNNLADELQKLARMRDQRILSEDEFHNAKKKLLG